MRLAVTLIGEILKVGWKMDGKLQGVRRKGKLGRKCEVVEGWKKVRGGKGGRGLGEIQGTSTAVPQSTSSTARRRKPSLYTRAVTLIAARTVSPPLNATRLPEDRPVGALR